MPVRLGAVHLPAAEAALLLLQLASLLMPLPQTARL